nr:hypothetical protein [Coxiella endosymbiont of Dermacentor marginatus]
MEGLKTYLLDNVCDCECLPKRPWMGSFSEAQEMVDWAVIWLPEREEGLEEMNLGQLRETTMNPDTRRLVQLTVKARDKTEQLLDMLLTKKRVQIVAGG